MDFYKSALFFQKAKPNSYSSADFASLFILFANPPLPLTLSFDEHYINTNEYCNEQL
jgi:hypothetical protein